VLTLTLSSAAFEITGTEEKPYELRHFSNWIASRLQKQYDYVLLINGYGHHRPWKLIEFVGVEVPTEGYCKKYQFSNGLVFNLYIGDYIIKLGETKHEQR